MLLCTVMMPARNPADRRQILTRMSDCAIAGFDHSFTHRCPATVNHLRNVIPRCLPLATFVRRLWCRRRSDKPTYQISAALFLRLLGVVYLIAFVSLWTQIEGLIGASGILPVRDYLDAAARYYSETIPPQSAVWNLPTLLWLRPDDVFLNTLCASGTLLALLLIAGVLPLPTLILLWLLYLSLVHAGQVFLSFQWDVLLLETGFAAVFLAPCRLRSRLFSDGNPSRLAIWLIWWLLFRLMFESGAVKLTWNNWQFADNGALVHNTWESLTAMHFHYQTQPLPVWTSWYAAKLPSWFHQLSVVCVFVIELGLPLMLFGPRCLRLVACGGLTLLMLLIAGTGNYNFFNLLTILLAMTLIDDQTWPQFLRRRISAPDRHRSVRFRRFRNLVPVPFATFAVLLGGLQLRDAVLPPQQPQLPLESRLNISQLFLVNDYGLFRHMTETRPEIVIEASPDGSDWKEYTFRWKPGDPAERPRFVTPHQPRLDWQMWFEALRFERQYVVADTVDLRYSSPWFQSFLMRLLRHEESVIGLLSERTVPEAAPEFIRVVLYEYRFTTTSEAEAGGNWWHRDLVCIGQALSLDRQPAGVN